MLTGISQVHCRIRADLLQQGVAGTRDVDEQAAGTAAYGFTPRVIKPPYPLDPPGISDHKYVTEHLGIGDHTDMGDDFIWDILESDVNEFLGVSLSRDPKIDYVFDELSKLLASRSPYREDDNPFETAVGVLLMVDRSEHMRLVEDAAQRARVSSRSPLCGTLNATDADGSPRRTVPAYRHPIVLRRC